ncbi:FAD-dependent oxidoreductase [Herbidospora mongoliensis]|uniref:FAD-dependent oxidoreductase n=1 Tax=Herbidospora mongoliensis TaxID=688067 RepID=UPI000833CCEF|nr:FAD-dependent oxidoreductase [Herbidospora mongoliensis]
MTQQADVVVVGGGVVGLTTAIALNEAGMRTLVWTAELPRRTTSAVAGALLGGPVMTEPRADAMRWQTTGLEIFNELAARPHTGVTSARGRLVSKLGPGTPPWARDLPGFAECSPEELAGFPSGFWITSPVADMPCYLDYLVDRLCQSGGDLEVCTVASLEQPTAVAPVVINCAGVAGGTLACDDSVTPVRGQHVVVANPGLTEFFYEGGADDDWTGFFPHGDHVVLGGNARPGDWSLEPDERQTADIIKRCAEVEPRLADARVIKVDVGLRPGRPSIRLEEENADQGRLIHNYGHAGVGVSMSWGCALDVVKLVSA